MKTEVELLSFLDLLDLDEEVIDKRLEGLMLKSHFSNENLSNLLHLLQYKHLINTKEDAECENDQEISMVNNLLSNLTESNVQVIGKVIFAILTLSPSTIVGNAEHLLQQVLADVYIPTKMCNSVDYEMESHKIDSTLLKLKICKCILDAVIYCRQKLLMPFLEISLEHLIYCQHEELNTFFVTSMIPLIFEAITGYHILDRIWNLLKQSTDQCQNSLKVLCSLSNYYLPVINYESSVIYSSEFWDIILYGLSSECYRGRKFAMYLFKRALDCLMISRKDVHVTSESVFIWKASKREELHKIWNDFFVLMDSLEEKQSNIVLPSLVLINTVKGVGYCWLNCAFKIGLSHDNAQVRFKCIQYRLHYPIHDINEAHSLLEALNDTNLFGDPKETRLLWNKMKTILEHPDSLINVLKTMANIKWAPVPLYYFTKLLAELEIKLTPGCCKNNLQILHHLFKISCTNIVIRRAVYANLFSFIRKCCHFKLVDYIKLCGNLPPEIIQNIHSQCDANNCIMADLTLSEDEKKHSLELFASHSNIDFALIYCKINHSSDIMDIINKDIDIIKDICERQYSQKSDCISQVLYLTEFCKRMHNKPIQGFNEMKNSISKTVLNYIKTLIASDTNLDIEILTLLYEGLDIMMSNIKDENIETLTHIFKYALLLLKDTDVDLNKRALSISTIACFLKSPIFMQYVSDSDLITVTINGLQFNNKEGNESIGRLKNMFYEKTSEIFYLILENHNVPINKDVINFIDDIFQSGGYGCLNWVLKIMNKLIRNILEHNKQYDISQFLNRAWIGIEELKTNSQYAICMKEFISLLMHDALLEKTIYNNVILAYCTKIIEYGAIKTLPLYYLVNEINLKDMTICSHIIYIFTDILLYTIVPKKENRILENVIEELLRDAQYNMICKTKDFHFASHIRYLSLQALSKIRDTEVLNSIIDFILKKMDDMFKNKQRYHGNSQVHRTVQAALQNLLFITLKSRLVDINKIGLWCIELLGKLPHQQFVRTCLEWYISLYFYIEDIKLTNNSLKLMQAKNVPITSQFLILYYVIMHKIRNGSDYFEEYDFVMSTLLSHTMGPTYSTRLYAQYLAYQLKVANSENKSKKYDYILEVIEQTLNSASAEKDKTYHKLLKDYFVHKFDIVEDLTPWRIFHYLPTTDNFNENVDDEFFEDVMEKINLNIENETKDSFYNEWIACRKPSLGDKFEPSQALNICPENSEVGTIQKKYIPWKNMSDINVYGVEEKRNKSDLIVVASLIDRLPNLGGMARTSEVFGVLTYVVNSLRHLQDKQFQGLSVSAERWIDVEEVRPGQPLKDYLMMKKTEGYSIVAAEQTSSSKSLQTYKFPKKTLLLLGHEKEGVPCNLLPLMDSCVEIPQQGVIRSLNVHVTAAIFIWEYARQNML
ncbi:uncharacterized protein LOC121739931 [Aricia agestis]|uniref:uncharacterized protein LOC121739931 n=1 Tax=Aricia agestis TaxID=91739 RepID=UPI001C202363|nr:uncharacterized protein LOC121739931 [Aricia agestis]